MSYNQQWRRCSEDADLSFDLMLIYMVSIEKTLVLKSGKITQSHNYSQFQHAHDLTKPTHREIVFPFFNWQMDTHSLSQMWDKNMKLLTNILLT